MALWAGLLAITPIAPRIADDEDVPKREPALAWERTVECDTAAELAEPANFAPRRCTIAVAGGDLFLHEHTSADVDDGVFRLTNFDVTTGEQRWARAVRPSSTVEAFEELVVVSAKTHFQVYDPATGDLRFERDRAVDEVNRYGTLLLSDGTSVVALDPHTGDELWTADGALGAFCRDIVVVVAATTDESGDQPFTVLDHYTGEHRWTSDEPFDPRAGDLTCGFGPFVYTTDGFDVREWDAYSGWINWTTSVPGAAAIELYREVALVRSDTDGATIVAVERETGTVRWERPTGEVGTAVSIIGRVREDAEGVFTLLPMTGDIVNHTSPDPSRSFDVVESSDTRIVIAAGSVVTAYGVNDLGTSWQFDVGGAPDEFGVGSGYLVARTGASLRGYG